MAKQGFKSRPSNGTALEGVNGITVSNPQVVEIDSSTGQLGAGSITTFSPELQFGGASTGITYNSRAGRAYRIGNICYINLSINLSSKGSAVGDATITGIPFTALATNQLVIRYGDQITITAGQIPAAFINNGTGTIFLEELISGAQPGSVTDTFFTNISALNISGCFFIQ